jgi:hypothetical protein
MHYFQVSQAGVPASSGPQVDVAVILVNFVAIGLNCLICYRYYIGVRGCWSFSPIWPGIHSRGQFRLLIAMEV